MYVHATVTHKAAPHSSILTKSIALVVLGVRHFLRFRRNFINKEYCKHPLNPVMSLLVRTEILVIQRKCLFSKHSLSKHQLRFNDLDVIVTLYDTLSLRHVILVWAVCLKCFCFISSRWTSWVSMWISRRKSVAKY